MTPQQIAEALGGAKRAGSGYNCRCPVHDDTRASLNVAEDAGTLLVRCYAGCEQSAVLGALRERGLLNGYDREAAFDFTLGALGKPVAVWKYRDATGTRDLLAVARYQTPAGKEIRPWMPDGGRWKCGAHPAPRPLYGLDVLAQHPALPVLVVEGEKACDAARELVGSRYAVTTWPGGANAADKADWAPLRGRAVILWPDADPAGAKAMQAVAGKLAGIASGIRLLAAGDRPKGWDAADAKAEGWTGDDVLTLIDEHATPIETRAQSDATALPLIWARDAGPLLDVPYVAKGVIGRGELAVIYGAPKSGKTFLAADLALSVATGRTWLGTRTTPGLVVYVAAEMGRRVERRIRAWLDHYQIAGNPPLAIVPRVVNLLDLLDVDRLMVTLDALVAAHGQPVLIVFDTLARSMAGGDENSAQDMGRAVAVGDRLRDRFEAATVLVHHQGKTADKGARGSSALLGAADAYLRVDADDLGNHSMTVEWSRDGEAGRQFGFRLPVVELGTDADGDRVTTCVLAPADVTVAAKPKSNRRDVALEALREAIGEFGERVPASSTIPPGTTATTVDRWKARWTLRTGYTDSPPNSAAVNFHKDRAALLAADKIAISMPYVWITN